MVPTIGYAVGTWGVSFGQGNRCNDSIERLRDDRRSRNPFNRNHRVCDRCRSNLAQVRQPTPYHSLDFIHFSGNGLSIFEVTVSLGLEASI